MLCVMCYVTYKQQFLVHILASSHQNYREIAKNDENPFKIKLNSDFHWWLSFFMTFVFFVRITFLYSILKVRMLWGESKKSSESVP